LKEDKKSEEKKVNTNNTKVEGEVENPDVKNHAEPSQLCCRELGLKQRRQIFSLSLEY